MKICQIWLALLATLRANHMATVMLYIVALGLMAGYGSLSISTFHRYWQSHGFYGADLFGALAIGGWLVELALSRWRFRVRPT